MYRHAVATRKWMLCLLASLLISAADRSVAQDIIQQRVFEDADGEHKYGLFLPQDYSPQKKWPVVLFLHGAGERGSDGIRQTRVGLGPALRANPSAFPFIAVFPQCEDTQARYLAGWVKETKDATRALAILESVEKEFSVDPERRVLTGWSMGGYGTWSLAASDPNRWSAIVPLAGGGTSEMAKALAKTPVWAFHGSEDAAIRPSQSRRMIAALREAGAKPRYTEVTGGGHEITEIVYGNERVIDWMLDPENEKPSALVLSVDRTPGQIPGSGVANKKPFEPALVLKSAAKVRLGNRMLDALAMSIPDMLPEDLLSGKIADIYDSTQVEGRNFNITFGSITYSTDLFRIRVKGYKKDRLNVQIGLRNASLKIGGTSVVGRDHSATAGPIDIVIGHRYPVWVSFDVTPFIEKERLRLKLVASRFDIPNDNWYVTQPAGVSVRGFGMTRKKVTNGLVNGLYGNRARIEREVRGIVPKLVAEMEKQLSLDDADEVVGSFWPLPVYQPNVRVFPEAVSVDEKGVSLLLGVQAAAIEGTATPEKPKTQTVAQLDVADVSASDNLEIAVAPNMLQYLTEMLVDAGVAKIHVLDIPEASFDSLANIDEMGQAIPSLRKLGPNAELWTELSLLKPIEVRGQNPSAAEALESAVAEVSEPAKSENSSENKGAAEDTASSETGGEAGESDDESANVTLESDGEQEEARPDPIIFAAPRLQFLLKVRREPTEEWTPFAELTVTLEQAATAQLVSPKDDTRALQLTWDGAPELTLTSRALGDGTAADIDDEKLKAMIQKAWQGWTGLGPAAQTAIPDLDFGLTKLRLSEANWSAPWLGITFSAPGVKLTNSTEKPLVYETKGPFSGWGGPYTLEAGKTHRYDIAYPMTWRTRINGQQSAYTLSPGTHSEFRIPRDGGTPELFRARENLDVVATPGGGE